jgi:hypothetical protein
LGAAYQRAAAMVPRVAPDQVMAANLAQISARRADLATHDAEQFERIVRDRVARLGSGTTGRQAMEIADELEGQAANYSSSSDGSQRAMGALIGDVAREVRGLIGRSSPQADALIQQADEGYTIYVRLRDAASKGKDGIATPSGLRTAVKTQDKSVGKGNVATGDAALYDLANASHIMPDQFGNPGTGNAIGLGALLVGAPTAPVATAATAASLGAAAAPYMMMGRQILESLPPNATRVQLLAAQRQLHQLAQQYPAVSALEQALALKIYQASGAGAVSADAMSAQ